MESTFIKIGEGKDKSNLKETIFKMDTTEKNLLRNFLEVRNILRLLLVIIICN